jgi:hypothetical protein
MKSDMRSRTTSRLVLPAAIAVFVAFGITQSRMVAIDGHQPGDVLISAGNGPVERGTNLGNTSRHRTPNLSTNGFGFGKLENLYSLAAAQLPADPICEADVTQGGWGYTTPFSNTGITAGRATFGGSASLDKNGFPGGQEQYSDHNPVDPFDFHSVLIYGVTCSGTEATIEGQGRVTKLNTFVDLQENFKIVVDDFGKPATGMDTYHITLIGDFVYDSGVMILQGGNVQMK